MNDAAILLAQFVLVAALAGWMVSGVLDNLRHPALNRESVALVMRMELMARDYPEDHAHVARRAVTRPGAITAAFALIVLWELVAALALLAGAGALGLALLGQADPQLARQVALAGTLAFTVNWAGFLIGGNYFCYWYCHFPAQATHMMLALWGTLVTLALILPG